MHNNDTELIFPGRVMPKLRELRGATWRDLVDAACVAPQESAEHMGFILMMVRLNGCASCNADSFRAMQGCTQCARQVLRRYRGSDKDLVKLYRDAKHEVEHYLREKQS